MSKSASSNKHKAQVPPVGYVSQAPASMEVNEPAATYGLPMSRVAAIRRGLPSSAIERMSERTRLPVRQVLAYMRMPQTTYNKKLRANEPLDAHHSEQLMVLSDLLQFGTEVFNNESPKFYSWLQSPNQSLGGLTPESLFDTLTGMQEVKNCLLRLEYGNMA
jgi:putative toxin-antitoxin system antitoxin component (TIGR02293 family)